MENINSVQIQNDTKQKIFNAAAELFTRDGYHKTSVREICEAAKVTKPVLYYYFKDKETLLEELVNETYAKVDEMMKIHLGNFNDLKEVLSGIVKLYVDFLAKYPHLTRFSAFLLSSNIPERILAIKINRYKSEMERFTLIIQAAQKKGIVLQEYNAEILAINYIGTVVMMIGEALLLFNNFNALEYKLNSFNQFWFKTFIINDTMEN